MAKKVSRSGAGNVASMLFLIIVACFMVLPMVYAVGNSFKPMDELFKFPPTLLPQRWVTTNYTDLFVLMGNSWVPFSRNFLFLSFLDILSKNKFYYMFFLQYFVYNLGRYVRADSFLFTLRVSAVALQFPRQKIHLRRDSYRTYV